MEKEDPKREATIRSVTSCPTCGTECTIGGTTTHYYIPKTGYSEEDMRKAFEWDVTHITFEEWIKQFKKK